MTDLQDIASALGPWLGIVSGSAFVISLIARVTGRARLRHNLAVDAALAAQLDGAAKASMLAAVDHQAERLRQRVVDGYRLSPLGDIVLDMLAIVLVGVGWLYLSVGLDGWPADAFVWMGLLFGTIGTAGIVVLVSWRIRGYRQDSPLTRMFVRRAALPRRSQPPPV